MTDHESFASLTRDHDARAAAYCDGRVTAFHNAADRALQLARSIERNGWDGATLRAETLRVFAAELFELAQSIDRGRVAR